MRKLKIINTIILVLFPLNILLLLLLLMRIGDPILRFFGYVLSGIILSVLFLIQRKRSGPSSRWLNQGKLKKLLQVNKVGLLKYDTGSKVFAWDPVGMSLLGLEEEKNALFHLLTVIHQHHRLVFQHQWSQFLISSRKKEELTFPLHGMDQTWLKLQLYKERKNPMGQKIQGILTDISTLKQFEQKYEATLRVNLTTNLGNQQACEEDLNRYISLVARREKDQGFALVNLDINQFRELADTLGQHETDQLLRMISTRLTNTFRQSDRVYHFGRDEFAIFFTHLPSQETMSVLIQQLQRQIQKPFIVGEDEIFLTASLGICLYPQDGFTGSELIQNSRSALVQAKSDQQEYCFFTRSIHREITKKIHRISRLNKGLADKEFCLHYQPIYTKEKHIKCLEALVRWNHPEEGLLYPGDFLKETENNSFIIPLGEWILREACHWSRYWRESLGFSIPISVNLSPVQLKNQAFKDRVEQIMMETGTTPRDIRLEVPEEIILHSKGHIVSNLNYFKNRGFHIQIDNFGAGLSSLKRLKNSPVKTLKLDRFFTETLKGDPQNSTLIGTAVYLARGLNIDIVAQGVEEAYQTEALSALGITSFQGYHQGPPESPDAMTTILKKHKESLLVHEPY